MMDKEKLSGLLAVPQGGIFQTKAITLDSWGSSLTFDCLYDLNHTSTFFRLKLEDCREIQWRVYAHLKHPEDQTLPTATFVNLRLGSDNHRKPLHLLTDFFGLTVSYGTLKLENQT
jgi:hypothetical protein